MIIIVFHLIKRFISTILSKAITSVEHVYISSTFNQSYLYAYRTQSILMQSYMIKKSDKIEEFTSYYQPNIQNDAAVVLI